MEVRSIKPDLNKSTIIKSTEKILTTMEGDIRVKGDTIIITYYKNHEKLGLKHLYQNISQQLEKENISPKIP